MALGAVPREAHYFSNVAASDLFVLDAPLPARPDERPFQHRNFIAPVDTWPMSHCPSLCERADGSLVAAWYAGDREGSSEVAIYVAHRPAAPGSTWSTPVAAVTRWSAADELNRYIAKVGNPIVFDEGRDRLWLMYVTVYVGGWSGSALNVKLSEDGGATWGDSRRIVLSPFLNMSTLVRNPPVALASGGFAVPVYHEFLGKFAEMLWVRADETTGEIASSKRRITAGRRLIQPALVALDEDSGLVLMRDSNTEEEMQDERAIFRSRTDDGGESWTKATATGLPNPNSSMCAVRGPGGMLVLAYNDSRAERDSLALAISRDNGASWTTVERLEDEPGEKFGYPYLVLTRRGTYHLLYSWRKKAIMHVEFNHAWLLSRLEEGA